MIPFKYGTQEQYDAQTKNNSALYFISDTQRIYRGEELIAGVQAVVVPNLPKFESAVDGIIYIIVDDNLAQLYVKGKHDFVSITGEVLDDSIKNLDAFSDKLIFTSADDIEKADDSTLITAGAAKTLINEAGGVWEYLDGTSDTSKIYG